MAYQFLTADGTEQPVSAGAAYIDGYSFGDRLLEGVMFRIELRDGQPVCTGVRDDDVEYCDKFSAKQMAEWGNEAVDCAKSDMDLELADGTPVYLAEMADG